MRIPKCVVVIWAILAGQAAAAQKPDVWKAKYAGESAFFLKYTTELRLALQNDSVVAETVHEQDLVVLNESNAGMFSRSSVYHSTFSQLKQMEAYTVLPDGRRRQKVSDTKTTASPSRSVFYDDVQETSFDFPSLSYGAIAHLEYTLTHSEPHLLPSLSYPAYIPAARLEYRIVVPDAIRIHYVVKNDAQNRYQVKTEKRKGQTIYSWVLEDVKSEQPYGDAPDDRYYEPHILFWVTDYDTRLGKQRFIQHTDDLYRWSNSFTRNLNLQPDATLEKLTRQLTAGKTNELDKAAAIYRWVQQNIRYVAFENGLEGFRPRQAADVCSKRYGDCKDMSSILTTMLRLAGIEAYYTWIGTRDIPYTHDAVPLPNTDNHMISTARIQGKWYFIDGTSPNSTLQLPPSHIQGKQALVGKGEQYELLMVPVTPAATNRVVDTTIVRFTPDGIAGDISIHYTGYFGEDVHNAWLYRDAKGREDYVKTRTGRASNKYLLGKWQADVSDSLNKTARLQAAYTIPGYGKKLGNEYYINLNLEKLFEKQLMDTAKRKVPRQFEYLYEIEEHHVLEIPQGYTVQYLPKNVQVETPFYALSISYTQQPGKVIATQKLVNKGLMLQPADFVAWNQPLPAVEAAYKEQVVLEKQ